MTVLRRRRALAGYHAQVGGIGNSSARVEVDEETDFRAVCAAFGAASAFGHTLGSGRRFLGYFEPGEARTPRELPELVRAAWRSRPRDAPW